MFQRFIFSILLIFGMESINGGPVWPDRYSVGFHEILYGKLITYGENEGKWYYDYANQRARFDHLNGQTDNFCQGQGLSPRHPFDDCHLLFSPDTAMYVHYPNAQTCCRLCAAGIGCTPLKPNWLANTTMEGTEEVEGKECKVYHVQGAVAQDYWMDTMDDIPCRYYESLPEEHPIFFHNLTFYPETYTTDPIDEEIFDIPDYCYKDCPNPYTPPDGKQYIF